MIKCFVAGERDGGGRGEEGRNGGSDKERREVILYVFIFYSIIYIFLLLFLFTSCFSERKIKLEIERLLVLGVRIHGLVRWLRIKFFIDYALIFRVWYLVM